VSRALGGVDARAELDRDDADPADVAGVGVNLEHDMPGQAVGAAKPMRGETDSPAGSVIGDEVGEVKVPGARQRPMGACAWAAGLYDS